MRLVQVDGPGEYQPIAGSFREDLDNYAKNREFVTIEFFDGKEVLSFFGKWKLEMDDW